MPAKKDKGQLTVDKMLGEAAAQREWEYHVSEDGSGDETAPRDAARIRGSYKPITREPAPSAPPSPQRQSTMPQHLMQRELAGPAPPNFVPKPHGEGVKYAKRKINPSTYMVQARKKQLVPFQYNSYNSYLTAPKNVFYKTSPLTTQPLASRYLRLLEATVSA